MSAVAERTTIQVRPLTPVIGAEISGIDLRQPLAAASYQLAPDLKQKLDALTLDYRRGDSAR